MNVAYIKLCGLRLLPLRTVRYTSPNCANYNQIVTRPTDRFFAAKSRYFPNKSFPASIAPNSTAPTIPPALAAAAVFAAR